jgi:hypothetical protein
MAWYLVKHRDDFAFTDPVTPVTVKTTNRGNLEPNMGFIPLWGMTNFVLCADIVIVERRCRDITALSPDSLEPDTLERDTQLVKLL